MFEELIFDDIQSVHLSLSLLADRIAAGVAAGEGLTREEAEQLQAAIQQQTRLLAKWLPQGAEGTDPL